MVRSLDILGCLAALLTAGCSDMMAKDDGHAFGDDLGRFRVGALLKNSSCGATALDTPEKWNFDVILSKDGSSIYWNTGAEAVEGKLTGNSFAFTSDNVVPIQTTDGKTSDCTVVRTDDASGDLDDASDARAFNGSLSYRFTPQNASACTDLIAGGAFEQLPCAMTYKMAAEWVSKR